jgi:hypothetical protein
LLAVSAIGAVTLSLFLILEHRADTQELEMRTER